MSTPTSNSRPVLSCALCRADLSVRPVMREVRRPGRAPGNVTTFRKHVHVKPAQVVIMGRVEGSHRREELPDALKRGVLDPWELRVCVDCLRGRTFAEVLAVALDRRLEAGG